MTDKNTILKQKVNLSKTKQALLNKWTQGKNTKVFEEQLILQRSVPNFIPLSYAQQRLWFLEQLEPGNSAYLLPTALNMRGQVESESLEQALQEVISRHESLRTTFAEQDGQPVQVIHAPVRFLLPVIDLHGVSSEQRAGEAGRLARQEAQHPCNLIEGPLLRTALLRLEREEHVLLLTLHHSITDGWSNEVLVRELTTLYRSFEAGQSSPLAPLPIQYADYALWQRAWLQGEVLEAQLAYWRTQLAEVSPLELPSDHPRPAVQSSRGAVQSLLLPLAVLEQLVVLSRQEHVTLFMTLLAAFQVLVQRYSGQSDFSVGTPIANRRQAEIEGLIGFFVNTLVLRSDLSGDPSFVELLQRVREVCLGAYAHQDVPFEQVVEVLAPTRDLSRSPLFQVMLVLQNISQEQTELAGVQVRALEVESTISKFDLTLSLSETAQGLHCALEYNTDLFEGETIARLLGHWQTLLQGIVQDPQAHLWQLPLLTKEEREQLLVSWNATATPYPQELCVHQLFEWQVARTPEVVALVYEEQALTYGQLNGRANQLARSLQHLGVGPEVLVGLCLERSPLLIVSMLAILKAGGTYVPLDAAYPKERLAFMLTDTQILLVLTQVSLCRNLPEQGVRLLCVDTDWNRLVDELDSDDLESEMFSAQLAYVMYTSGSTGQPKGVSISHQAIVRLVCETNYIHLTPSDVVAQAANPSFDAATFEIWGALLCGARVVGISKETLLAPHALEHRLREQEVTTLFVTTALFNEVARTAPAAFRRLRYLLFGGEAVEVRWVREVLRVGSPHRLLHVYGPTESTTYASWYRVQEVMAEQSTIPIGFPLANTQLYVLDGQYEPVPIGVIGELYIGGDGVARGYFKRAALTAERFVPDPWSGETGARLYRTGDLVCYREGGSLEYVGRVDQQVKIRGYRIELGEIEAVLRTHAGIQVSVVVAREDRPGDKRLVAYVVVQPGPMFAVSELRTFLQDRLPAYMLPSNIVLLDALPLTPNGKLDRKGLPAPEQWEADKKEGQPSARTPIEEIVQGLWSSVLGRAQVGMQDNFFEVGGHSLLATQLLARVRGILGVEIPLRTIFEEPTVVGFAQRVQELLRQGDVVQMPPLLASTRPEHVPLSYAQQRLWFLEQLEPGSPAYLIPSALTVRGQVKNRSLEQALQAVISRHESLRTTFREQDGQPVQVIHPADVYWMPMIDLQGVSGEQRAVEAQCLAQQEAQRSCDLVKGPLLRTALLRLEREEHVLLLTLHHSITDGWSNEVLVRELTMLYRSLVDKQPSPLAPLPIQYADYALWQREWLQGEVLEAQLGYWRTQLADVSPLELPTDHPRPAVQSSRGAVQSLLLPLAVSEQLAVLSQQEHVTVFMTLLAAFQVLMQHYSGQNDFSVGTPIANRRQAEIEGLIGFFVNTLVLRSDLSGDPSFVELLRRVREVCLGAYAHQDVPFEQVVEALAPTRDLSRSPLFQVMLALQNTPQEQTELAGVQMRALEVESMVSKFDLTLSLSETAQGLHCALEYNTDLFEAETIIRLLGHWQTLLQGIVQDPQVSLSELPLLTKEEREQLLVSWNATATPSPQDLCVHQLFEQQVERTPEAVALVSEEQMLTYGQLNARANQLANQLQGRGVGPEVPVGICIERSLEMVVAMLGILKAGGAYVPLDPTYPQERLAFILTDAKVALLLTHHVPDALRLATQSIQSIDLAREGHALSRQKAENPSGTLSSENLCYVIYTSGSTGIPKGVQITHSNLLNLIDWHQNAFSIQASDRATQVSSPAFDATGWEVWPYLTCGASVFFPKEETRLVPTELRDWLILHAITMMFLPTPLVEQMMRLEWSQTPYIHVRSLLTGADILHHGTPSDLPFALINNYGPTETTVVATSGRVASMREREGPPSIGRPISNTEIYLLDASFQLVPIGVEGELYIGGAGLGRGYRNQADRTAALFLPHPFSVTPGARLYRTGDLACYLPDGQIAFIGRRDHQVKIRGYRIELGEIESVLRVHAGIQSSVVVVREDRPGDKRLVAYVVVQPGQTLPVSELRTFLQDRLPTYMLPSDIVLLDELPLTPNGKLDRKGLPAPDWERSQDNAIFLAPRSAIEKTLTSIWEEILHTKAIGIQDNFFERGGDSIISIQIIARARQQGLRFTLKQLFQHQTIEQLSTVVVTELVQAEQGIVRGSLPLTPIQRWFFDLDPIQLHHWNQALFFEIAEHLRGSLLAEVVRAWLRQHDALRLRFCRCNDGWSQSFAALEEPIPCLLVDLSALGEEDQQTEATDLAGQTQASLDVGAGPLVRVVLFERGSTQAQLLLMVIHHLAIDGVSWRILLDDLHVAYQQVARGEGIVLPAKTSSFKAWAEHLVAYAHSPQVQQAQRFWLSRNWEQVRALPRDRTGNEQSNTIASARTLSIALNVEETNALLTEVPAVYHTQINDVLLTALVQTFTAWMGTSHVLIDLEGHGREDLFVDLDISRTVGWFTSLFPVYLTPGETVGVSHAIENIKEQLGTIPNHGIDYGILRYLSTDRAVVEQLQTFPQAEVSFNYLGQLDQVEESSGRSSLIAGSSRLSAGSSQSEQGRRSHLIEITCEVSGNQFRTTWSYGEGIHWRSTIEGLASAFLAALREIIHASQFSEARSYTPADFAEVPLTQKQIELVMKELDFAEERVDE